MVIGDYPSNVEYPGRRKYVLFMLIVFSLIVIIAIPLMLTGVGSWKINGQQVSSPGPVTGIIISATLVLFAVVGWLNYFKQKQIYEGNYRETGVDKVLEVGYKIGGYVERVRAVVFWFISLVLFSIAIGTVFFGLGNLTGSLGSSNPEMVRLIIGGVILILSILFAIAGWYNWWLSKSLVKGKLY